MRRVAILGSTGSVGVNALAVCAHLQSEFKVVGLAAGRNVPLLAEQAQRFHPAVVSTDGPAEAEEFKRLYRGPAVRVVHGPEGAEDVARLPESDIAVCAIAGTAGLRSTLAAAEAGKRISLANKESMVVAGELLLAKAAASGTEIIPVDSEHSGVFQCLMGQRRESIRKVILTASGGPFLRTSLSDLESRTVEEALRHPRWAMGPKVTIDSSTLMNKGLELIEARWLFDLKPDQLDILIHPQSIVHSLVAMKDGSVLAQLGPTDMRIPIQFALTYPERRESLLPPLELELAGPLEFAAVDPARFPLVGLARQALVEKGSFAVVLNAANEVAVQAFLSRRIAFPKIHRVVDAAVGSHRASSLRTLDDILRLDGETRRRAEHIIAQGH